jgi:hypothetical protein
VVQALHRTAPSEPGAVVRLNIGSLTIEASPATVRCSYGPFEAQREGARIPPDFEYADYFGPVRSRRGAAIRDARRLGPDAIVRNTRNGKVVWRDK